MKPKLIIKLTKVFNRRLPGKSTHEKMIVRPKQKFPEKKRTLPAAVLVLLYPVKENWYFYLTKRTKTVAHHKGQISLPGGMLDEGESSQNAAIRETYEELGIKPKDINIIGPLTPLYIPISSFKIFPFVGWITKKTKLNIQSKEVSKVFSPSISSLINPQNKKIKISTMFGQKVKIPFFDLNNEIVWGATSMILSEFKSILKEIK
ncbi:MAG: hypothetical protein CMF94_01780 [Candidatus Marinimicrobia bacterium]|nr:hypothetical protein [Candidatus Neomarinimicrobiota bacterium]